MTSEGAPPPVFAEGSRRPLLGIALAVLPFWALWRFIGGRWWFYHGAVLDRDPLRPLAGSLAFAYDIASALVALIVLGGCIAIYVLGVSFARHGKAGLDRRSDAWWISCFAFGALLVLGLVATHLPFVDVKSNTEVFFLHLARAVYPFNIYLPFVIWLLFEVGRARVKRASLPPWPPAASRNAVERVRIFRWGGVREEVAYLQRQLTLGERQFDANHKETTGPGPRVFHGKASIEGGVTYLRNTYPGVLFSEDAPRQSPRDADSIAFTCDARRSLALDVRRQCPWDYAFVAKPRLLGKDANGSEYALEGARNLDATKPIPDYPLRIRDHSQDPDPFPSPSIFLAREDPTRPGLLDFSGKRPGPRYYYQERDADAQLRRCEAAREAWARK